MKNTTICGKIAPVIWEVLSWIPLGIAIVIKLKGKILDKTYASYHLS